MMKKAIILALLSCLAMVDMGASNPLSKATQKTYKKECKELKKEGWKVFDNEQSLDEALLQYYLLLDKGEKGAVHIIGTGKSKAVNTARRKAMINASAQLAALQGSDVSAVISTQITSQTTNPDGSTQEFDTSVRTSSEAKLKDFVPVVSLYRELPNGMTEMKLYYYVDIK